MKYFLRLISLLFLCGVLFNSVQAQNQQKIDSLLNVLKTAKEDTNKVNHLNAIGWELMNINPDTSILLSTQALQIAEKNQWKKGIANSYNQLGWFNFLKGEFSFALEHYNKAIALWDQLNDKRGKATTLGRIGSVYQMQADFSKAVSYYLTALKIAEEIGDKNKIAGILGNIGVVYDVQGDYAKSLDYYFKALKMKEELGLNNLIASTLCNIGVIYMKQADYPKALDYYFRALKMDEEFGAKNYITMILGNIGIVYGEQADYPKALDYAFRTLKIAQEQEDKYCIATTLGNIGSLYIKQNKLSEADKYLDSALKLATEIKALDLIKDDNNYFSELYSKKGDWKKAYEYHIQYIAARDSMNNEEKVKKQTQLEMNYEFDKKEVATKAENEKQLAVADVEIKKQKLIKNYFIGGLALLLILSFFVYNNFRIANKLKLQNIRNRIASDLHDDVGSTLNSISVYSEVAKQKSPAVVDELEQIGDASRKIIEVMSDIVWTINPKNDTFENIISRMGTLAYNLLKAKNIEHTFQADENLNELKLSLESRRNFYLIFKEALNNLVKYSQATRASITLTNENGLIKLAIRDNGVGFDVAQTSKGNGLLNMKNRAEEMKAQLKIESEKGSGTNLELIFKA